LLVLFFSFLLLLFYLLSIFIYFLADLPEPQQGGLDATALLT